MARIPAEAANIALGKDTLATEVETTTVANQQVPPIVSSAPIGLRKIDSLDLLEGARSVVIMHAGERYQLRVTRANRLILTK